MHNNFQISKEFRTAAFWSASSIVLFIVTYVVLISVVLLLIAIGIYGSLILVASAPSFLTAALGTILMVMSILLFIFLFKFIFKRSVTDRSHLIEIRAEEHPKLFELIEQTVKEVGAKFPKRVYLAGDVNAAVFYDSSFWSMFLPVSKNLQIGMGLINSMSVTELKAVLAHEFGHFSQRSMKVGSYVYNVNRVLYDMLYDNEGYSQMANNWASLHGYVNAGVRLTMWLVGLIQGVLKKVYEVLNLSYSTLSREMEFHADAVAASVTGSEPMINALLRINLSNHALDRVYDFYNSKIVESGMAINFYQGQSLVMGYLAGRYQFPLKAGLPQVGKSDIGRFNKSKLILKDQWASHPRTVDRVTRLNLLDVPVVSEDASLASTLLRNSPAVEQQLTQHAFREVDFQQKPVPLDPSLFEQDFLKNEHEYALPEIYSGYYDTRNPYLDQDQLDFSTVSTDLPKLQELFNDQCLEDLKILEALQDDLTVIVQIENGEIPMKSFDYDGQRYRRRDCGALIKQLQSEIDNCSDQLKNRDRQIWHYFHALSITLAQDETWKEKYLAYAKVYEEAQINHQAYITLAEASAYMTQSLPLQEIRVKTSALKRLEPEFKIRIESILVDPAFFEHISTEQLSKLREYLSKDWPYFDHNLYFDLQVDMLFAAMGILYQVNIDAHYWSKKELLVYQAELAAKFNANLVNKNGRNR